MSTITIDLLGDVPETFTRQLATPEGMARARAAILAAFPELFEEIEEAKGTDLSELITALGESEKDIANGRTMTCEEQDARLSAKFPWLKTQAA
jgi:hypothetical protein